MATAVEVHPVADFNPTAPLKKPRGVAADGSGQALVLDDDGQIVKLDQSGKSVSTFGSGTGGPHSDEPSDLAIARDGSFLVLDAGRGQIDRYEASGRFLGSLGADWGMYRPRGLAVGASGKVYVADTGHNRVIVAADLKIEKELKDLDQPTDVEVDPRGWMYVVQPEVSKLAVFDQDGKQQATWDVSRSNTVEGPHLAFLESGALAVTDPARRLVVILDLNGRELELIGGSEPIFSQPYAIGSTGGRLLVTDSARPGVKAFEVLSR